MGTRMIKNPDLGKKVYEWLRQHPNEPVHYATIADEINVGRNHVNASLVRMAARDAFPIYYANARGMYIFRIGEKAEEKATSNGHYGKGAIEEMDAVSAYPTVHGSPPELTNARKGTLYEWIGDMADTSFLVRDEKGLLYICKKF